MKGNDIRRILPGNPYDKTEKETTDEYNSTKSTPQLVFLGLDESKKDGLQYKNYVGAPQFALDMTPKGPYEEEAKGMIAELERRGLNFLQGMRAMNFAPEVGRQRRSFSTSSAELFQLPFMQWAEPFSIGMHETRIAEHVASRLCQSMLVQNEFVHQKILHHYLEQSVAQL